jgi:ubiquinone/menaquinone biosynthesis C-methylase UbiE
MKSTIRFWLDVVINRTVAPTAGELSNLQTYEAQEVVQEYATESELQEPERVVLDLLRPELARMTMLDIGVGGGRTTLHFAPLVARYVAIDYSEAMIKACEERFSRNGNSYRFEVCDVRTMEIFEDDHFDFILIAFNGLDYVDHEGRLQALREMRRVCKPDGRLAFSSHNLYGVDRLLSLNVPGRMKLKNRVKRALHVSSLRLLNPPPATLKKQSHAVINDGVYDFRLKTYYVKPEYQIQQLAEAGFSRVQIFALDGQEISGPAGFHQIADPWLYYLCTT